jgi:hypothetical protein
MVLAKYLIWRPREQNRGPGYESTQLLLLNFWQTCQNIWCRKDRLFEKCYLENCISACRQLKLYPCLSLCTCVNSKWIKDLNVRPETLKLVQERAWNTLEAIGIGKNLLWRTQAAQQLRDKIDKRDYMKLKSFCTTKKWSLNWSNHPQNGKKSLLATYQTRDW